MAADGTRQPLTVGSLQLAPLGGWTRPMRWMIALMTAIAMLGSALALWAVPVAASLRGDIAGRLSIQLVDPDPASRRQSVAALRTAFDRAPFVRTVTVVPEAELRGMAEQWLGDGVSQADLPLPALIDVDLRGPADDALLGRATALAHSISPDARVIAHRDWLGPLAGLMASLGWLSVGLALALLLGAAGISAMAARAALAAQRSTIELFHLVGATDTQIMRLFQRVIARQALIGAGIGSIIALLVGGWFAWLGSSLTAGVATRPPTLVLLALLVPCVVTVVAVVAARLALARDLGEQL